MTADQPPARSVGRPNPARRQLRSAPRGFRPGPALALGVALACALALAACGGSASSSSSSSSASAATGAGGFNRTVLVACLKKQGITLPTRPSGSGAPPSGGGLFGGGGGGGGRRFGFASNPKIRAALQKCGLSLPRRTGNFRTSPAFKTAVNNFVACVRKNGYALPNPNLSGNGPVFKASQVNRKDPKFVAAVAKCQSLLRFARPGSFGGGGTATTAPGTATQ